VQLSEEELNNLIADVDSHWSETQRDEFLKRLSQSYEPFRQPVAESKKSKAKNKKTVEAES
jgi:CRISPR-associated protein Csc2